MHDLKNAGPPLNDDGSVETDREYRVKSLMVGIASLLIFVAVLCALPYVIYDELKLEKNGKYAAAKVVDHAERRVRSGKRSR